MASSDPERGSGRPIREVTVKSFSLANQIRRPGFQLLSLVSPSPVSHSAHTFADTPCFLPDQYSIYSSVYGTFFLFTLLLLFLSNIYRTRQSRGSPPTPISLSPVTERHNGSGTPVLHPESAVWSPYTPVSPHAIPRSTSPRSSIPSSVRTPNGPAAPTLRAFSRPSTPHTSPLLSPMVVPHDDDDDESLYPAQYAVRREGYVYPNSATWPSSQTDNDHQHTDQSRTNTSQFLPAPGLRVPERQRWSWSRTFIIRGRRLRLNIQPPSSFSLTWLKMLFSAGANLGEIRVGKRRSVVVGTAVDGLAIAWPAIVVWVAIAQWMF